MRARSNLTERRGAIIPMAAILSVAIFGMVAFAVDIGWIAVSQSELQNTADSAAFAGVNPLMKAYVAYQMAPDAATKSTVLTAALASAKANAKQYAGYNSAGGVNNIVLNDSDIEFGNMDSKSNYTPSTSSSGFPNTIKVVLRRDSSANQPLSLFFGPVLGTKATNLNATASATIYTGTVDSLAPSQFNSRILPITYDVNNWNNYLKTGKYPDGSTVLDSNGFPELQVYPSVKFPGNFGQLSLNDSHVGDSTEIAWVDNGVSSRDIQALLDAKLIPLSQHNSNLSPDWQGNTGFKANLVMDINSYQVQNINSYQGKTFTIPLFKPVNDGSNGQPYQAATGQGSNAFYTIVQFVGVEIRSSGNRLIIVQPAAVIDPNAVFNTTTVVPAGSVPSQGLVTTFTAPKLTR